MNAIAKTETVAPAVGQPWPEQGGIYAGILPTEQGDFHIILAPESLGEHAWGKCGKNIEGARSDDNGPSNTQAMAESGSEAARLALAYAGGDHADWYIPSLTELHLLFATCRKHFEKCWHWSSTQDGAYYAWYMGFADGYTDGSLSKDYDAQVRPVRRIPAQ